MTRFLRYFRNSICHLERWVDRPWAVPLLAAFALLDLFLLLIPTEGILISAVLLRPKRWIGICLWIVTGSALGALLLAGAFQYFGPEIMHHWLPFIFHSEAWARSENTIYEYGAPALAVIALSPLPQQPAVAIAALARVPVLSIFVMVWFGRLAKYALFAWLASHSPKIVLGARWPRWVPLAAGWRELRDLERAKKELE